MKPLLQAVLLLGFVMPAISSTPVVDFDGKSGKSIDVLQEITDNPTTVSETATPQSIIKDGVGTVDVKVAVKSESGEWIVQEPEKSADGVLRYSFLPDDEIQTTYSCTSSNPDPNLNYWKVSSKYTHAPSSGGHPHTNPAPPGLQIPAGTNLPNPVVSNVTAVNTSVVYYWKIPSPAYATRITQDATFSYACTGANRMIVDMKVPNLVELKAGTGYTLTGTTTQHPSPSNHYVTSEFQAQLIKIGQEWYDTCSNSEALSYNDMSLPWGGLFDVSGKWSTPHKEHRFGNNADVSKKWVRKGNRAKLVMMMCKSVLVHSEGDATTEGQPHYHLTPPDSKHPEDFPDPRDERYMDCCLSPGVPVGCIDLESNGVSLPEEMPEITNCP